MDERDELDRTGDELGERKRVDRVRMREVRAAIPPIERERQEKEVERRLMELPRFETAGTVLIFLSTGSEVETAGIVDRLRERGSRVLVPVVEGDTMEAVELLPGAALVTSSFGIMTPANGRVVEPAEIDLVVTPGLAFDRNGRRLGFGGGYFDRFLPRLRSDCLIVAVAFHQQIIDEVPGGPLDVPVHVIVTDEEVILVPGAEAPGSA
jgi:5-formyltetrahydrofolate cyclo-ligase